MSKFITYASLLILILVPLWTSKGQGAPLNASEIRIDFCILWPMFEKRALGTGCTGRGWNHPRMAGAGKIRGHGWDEAGGAATLVMYTCILFTLLYTPSVPR